MARLLLDRDPQLETRVLTRATLVRELRSEDRERVLDLLSNPTKGAIARAAELRRRAIERLAGPQPP